jgi:ribonuclease Z
MRFILIAVVGLVVAIPAATQTPPMAVTLLGTGTPNPRVERMGPSTLIEVGGQRLLVDAGRGTPIRLHQAGVRTGDVTAVFLTHLHSDHIVGLPDVWLTGWLPPLGGRSTALQVFGPTGTRELAAGLETAFAGDIRTRMAEERLPASGITLQVSEFDTDGVVYSEGGVRVTAFEVDHGGELKPAYGYRIDYAGRSVVISGDTRYSENLIRHAAGADVLLHEVAMAPEATRQEPAVAFVLSHHTSAADVARVFTRAKPRLALLTHVALPPGRQGTSSTSGEVLAEVSKGYTGRMELGEDLMQIIVADTIQVKRPQSDAGTPERVDSPR